jgi:hypothetical protein
MLWTYMQMHDAKSEDNTTAIVNAVNQLHTTGELPKQLLQWLDDGEFIDQRMWKIVHKVEKEFLENVSDKLHRLSLPNPPQGDALPQLLHEYSGGAADAVAATAGMSPAGSPLAGSSSQIHEFSYSQAVYHASFAGQGVGGVSASQSYLQPAGMDSHHGNDVWTASGLPAAAGMGGDVSGGLLSSAAPVALGVAGLQGSGGSDVAAAAAAGGYSLQGQGQLLTEQHPMLSCVGVPEGVEQELFQIHMQMLEAAPHSSSGMASGLGSCATLAANNSAVFAAAADSVAAGVVAAAHDAAPLITTAVNGQMLGGSAYASQSQMGPSSTGSPVDGQGIAVSGNVAAAAYSGHLLQHLTPVNSCEPGTGTPVNGSPLLNTIGCNEQQQQQFVAGLPGSAAYCSSGSAAAAEFQRRVAGHGYSDIRSDNSFGMGANGSRAAGSRTAGGHGPNCR